MDQAFKELERTIVRVAKDTLGVRETGARWGTRKMPSCSEQTAKLRDAVHEIWTRDWLEGKQSWKEGERKYKEIQQKAKREGAEEWRQEKNQRLQLWKGKQLNEIHRQIRLEFKDRRRPLPWALKDKTGTVQTETEAVLTLYQQGMKKKTNVGTTSGRIQIKDEAASHKRNAQWMRLAEKASRAPPPKIMKKRRPDDQIPAEERGTWKG